VCVSKSSICFRKLLKYLDDNLGEPIPEKDYGGNCRIYDWEQPENPFHNIKEKFDVFIFAHSFGYFCKTLIFRDWWFTTVISVMFEFLEYSLEHQVKLWSISIKIMICCWFSLIQIEFINLIAHILSCVVFKFDFDCVKHLNSRRVMLLSIHEQNIFFIVDLFFSFK